MGSKYLIINADDFGICNSVNSAIFKLLKEKKISSATLMPNVNYYEEAVENTPARQLETQFHGSGYSYRQCFQDGVFQFGEYDRLFQEAQNLESEDFCIELAVTRLMEKARLSQDAEGVYQSYLMEHRMSAAGWCIEFEQNETLEFLTGFIDWQEEELSDLIEEANAKGRLEIQSVLMDYKHHHFGKKKKTFDL